MFLVAREPLDDGEAALNDDDVNWFRDEIGTLSIRKSEGTITTGLESTTTAAMFAKNDFNQSFKTHIMCLEKRKIFRQFDPCTLM